MSQRAIVTSVEAIEAFRATLIVYLSKARPTLEEVSSDVLRMRSWLENDQRTHWEGEMRRRTKDLEAAQQALFSAKLGTLRTESSAEHLAVHRARRALDEADQKLRILKRWNRDFDGRVQPLVKQMEKLHTVLSNDMVKAAAYLAETVKTLAAYADKAPPPSLATVAPAGAPSTSAPAADPGKAVYLDRKTD
jgi:hypothetical protein